MSDLSASPEYPAVGLIGLETEYGITRDQASSLDHVTESMALVRAYSNGPFQRRWNYREEDPHRDARGFRVERLEQDEEEDEFAAQDAHRPFSFTEMKSDLVLSNGARFYNDHTHPEYSTPECRTLFDLVAHDRAGERIVWEATRRRNRHLEAEGQPGDVSVFKNNTDFHGHSYGCHDNYLVPRSVAFERLATGLIPFLISRQILVGAGKTGIESAAGHVRGRFQISQRADFLETEMSVNTMHNRPVINTRDEPHADPARFRRLHLILGDANMAEYSTALKVGTTRAVLELITRNMAPDLAIEQPVAAVKAISQDPDLKVGVRLRDRRVVTAIDLQTMYLDAARRALGGIDAEMDWILREWTATLAALARDHASLRGRVDWITKRWLLETFAADAKLEPDDPWLVSLDLAYHDLDPSRGLFQGLDSERTTRVAAPDAVERAVQQPPADTRAAIRGLCVTRFADEVESIQWGLIVTRRGATLDLGSLVEPQSVGLLLRLLQDAPSLSAAIAGWQDRMILRGHA